MQTSPFRSLAFALLLLPACAPPEGTTEGGLHIEATTQGAPKVGQNTLELTLRDDEGEPVSGATLTVHPFMSAHGHGSSETPQITDHDDGSYTAAPITLTMPGAWEVTISATHQKREGELVLQWDVE